MSLQERQGGNAVFLNISQGKFVRKVDGTTENAVMRVNKAGNTVHELFYTSLTGIISEVTTKDTEFGKFWVVNVKSDGNTYIVNINYASGYALSFIKALPNVDLSQVVEMSPALTKNGEYTNSVVFLRQNGKPIKHYFTKDNPNGMPERERIKVKGVETTDNTKQIEFLEDYVKTKLFGTSVPF